MTAGVAIAGSSFYNGSSPDRRVVDCPDCGHAADVKFGDHDGDCIADVRTPIRHSPLGAFRTLALDHDTFTALDLAKAAQAASSRPVSQNRIDAAVTGGLVRQWAMADVEGQSVVFRSLIKGQRVKERAR